MIRVEKPLLLVMKWVGAAFLCVGPLQAQTQLGTEVKHRKGQQLMLDVDDFVQKSFKADAESRLKEMAEKFEHNPKKNPFDLYLNPKLPDQSDGEKRATMYRRIFYHSSYLENQLASESLLHRAAWDDLKILSGTTLNANVHLLSKVFRGNLLLGEGMTSFKLVHPTNDVNELKRRQAITRIMVENPGLVEQLDNIIKQFAPVEAHTLSLYSPRDPLFNEAYNLQFEQMFYWKGLFAGLNESSVGLGVSKQVLNLSAGLPKLMMGAGTALLAAGVWNLTRSPSKKMLPGNQDLGIRFLIPGLFFLIEGAIMKSLVPIEEMIVAMYSNVKNRMAGVAAFLNTSKKLLAVIKQNQDLYQVLKQDVTRLEFLIEKGNRHRDVLELVNLSGSKEFRRTGFYKDLGVATLKSYRIFIQQKNQLIEGFVDLGAIDSYISTAKLVMEHQSKGNSYQFAQYLDAETPTLIASGFWNPFLDADKAVANDSEMGAGTARNQIVTGPNAGGKSTYINGLMMATLLAQSLGVVPARELQLTTFSRLSTYIHPTDDIAAGKSLYMAEVKRAQEHVNTLRNLSKDQFSFSIMDEIFSGTNPREGEAAAYSIAEYIANYENALNIVATHFPLLTQLETNVGDVFKNYKVTVDKETRSNGKFKLVYNFQVVPGISNQTIAIDILEEQGFDTTMLERAKDILLNPKNYYKD